MPLTIKEAGLKFKDDGSYVGIEMVKGDKGDTGDPAPPEEIVPAVGAWLDSNPETVAPAIDDWLEDNITQETGYVLDRSLSSAEAAAPADLVGYLKKSLFESTGNELIPITTDGLIRLSNSTVNLTPEANANYHNVVIECQEGDTFTLNGTSYGNAARLYAFADDELNRLEVAGSGATATNLTLIAPEDAAYLIVNDYNTQVKLMRNIALKTRVSNLESAVTESNYSYPLGTSFEFGAVWVTSGSLTYDTSSAIIRTKRNTTVHLNKDDKVVVANSAYKFKVISVGETITDTGFLTTDYIIPDDGNYIIAIATISGDDIESVSDATASVYVVDHKAPIAQKIEALSKETDVVEYSLYGLFEFGTAYVGSRTGSILYDTTDLCIRTIRHTTIAFNSGDIVHIENTPYKLRIIKSGETNVQIPESTSDWITNDYTFEDNGDYILVFSKRDGQSISSVDDALASVSVLNGNSFVVKYTDSIKDDVANLSGRVSTLENTIGGAVLNNRPRGVFGVMTYNVGCWYKGTGVIVPSEDYDYFLELQEDILDRYTADIVCIQEYRNNISVGHPATTDLLDKRYLNVATAKGDTTYDGKAICTSMTLEDATNVNYTYTDGAQHRNYEKAYVYCNGRKVCVISTHLSGPTGSGRDTTINASQCDELLAVVENEDYAIICADTNITADSASTEYAATLKKFVDAGMTQINDGTYMTAVHPTSHEYSSIDNIFVTSNITVKSVVVDDQKTVLGYDADHYPLIAYLEIY